MTLKNNTGSLVEVIQLQKRVEVAEGNLKIAKQILRKTSDINLEKDIKIQQLLKKNHKLNEDPSGPLPFENFVGHFESIVMNRIRSTKPGKSYDSKFILEVMRSLYKNCTEKLKSRSATGKKYGKQKKAEITLTKKEIMEGMLKERLTSELGDQPQVQLLIISRFKRLNRLVGDAIFNILAKDKRGTKDNLPQVHTEHAEQTLQSPQEQRYDDRSSINPYQVRLFYLLL